MFPEALSKAKGREAPAGERWGAGASSECHRSRRDALSSAKRSPGLLQQLLAAEVQDISPLEREDLPPAVNTEFMACDTRPLAEIWL